MKINVLHINSNYTYTNLHQCMLEKLDCRENISSQVFMATNDKKSGVVKPNSNVLVYECFKKWDRFFFNLKQSKILKGVQQCFDINQYNLIHAYTLFTDGGIAQKLGKKYNRPYVVAVRNTDVNIFFRMMPHLRRRGIQIMLDAKAVFFLSEEYRKQVFEKYVPRKYHQELKEKTHIIPNGIDDFWFENLPDGENTLGEKIKLIYAGRIDSNKNIPTTQKAMKILREKGYDVSLTVVGRVADEKVYKEIQADAYTECLPAQPKEELINLYRQHNIFVMPSFTESFGLVYAEAMSQGLPVIYSKGQGFDNQFPEGHVGYHVSANDAQDVADGIEKIIKNFEDIARNTVSSARVFNWKDMTDKYDTIYKEIVGESRG